MYLDHAGVAPLPGPAAEAVERYATAAQEQAVTAVPAWEDEVERVRRQSARLMGVPADGVAFVKNTTKGLGFVANGLDWSPGDRVVVPDGEFPSTVYPWLALRDRGVRVDLVEPDGPTGALPLARFADALERDPPPRLVACSWVQFARGYRADVAGLASLCHERGALLCLDVIQGLGVVPSELAAWRVDFASADSHKWMLGPPGAGLLYVAAEHRARLRPLEPGWNSVAHRQQWDNLDLVWDDSARRFEGGSHNIVGLLAMGASIDLLLDAGLDAVWAHVDRLCDRAAVGLEAAGATVLTDRSPLARSGIVTAAVDGVESETLVARLRDEDIVCSPRAGGVRISPHAYNTDDEIDAAIDAVGRLVGTGE